jgi:hypothetical protein
MDALKAYSETRRVKEAQKKENPAPRPVFTQRSIPLSPSQRRLANNGDKLNRSFVAIRQKARVFELEKAATLRGRGQDGFDSDTSSGDSSDSNLPAETQTLITSGNSSMRSAGGLSLSLSPMKRRKKKNLCWENSTGKHSTNGLEVTAIRNARARVKRRKMLEKQHQKKRVNFLCDMMRDPECWQEVEM